MRDPGGVGRTVAADPYPWPFDGDLRPANTALIVIDMQTDFCGKGGYVDRMGYDLSLTRAPIEPIRAIHRTQARELHPPPRVRTVLLVLAPGERELMDPAGGPREAARGEQQAPCRFGRSDVPGPTAMQRGCSPPSRRPAAILPFLDPAERRTRSRGDSSS